MFFFFFVFFVFSTVALEIVLKKAGGCGDEVQLQWDPNFPECVQDLEGFYPSLFMRLEKESASGVRRTLEKALGFIACNTGGWAYELPQKPPSDWIDDETDRLILHLIPEFFDPNIKEETNSVSFVAAECEISKAEAPSAAPVNNIDCSIGEWSFLTGCSVQCGAGTRRRVRYITQPSVGTGAACPETTCGVLVGCLDEDVACNGARENPQACLECTAGTTDCRCRDDDTCDGGLLCEFGQCRSPDAPPIGCLNCACRIRSPVCDHSFQCSQGTCRMPSGQGCLGCECNADKTCDTELVCSEDLQLCVHANVAELCTPGGNNCECTPEAACTSIGFNCVNNRCIPSTSGNADLDTIIIVVIACVVVFVCCAVVVVIGLMLLRRNQAANVIAPASSYNAFQQPSASYDNGNIQQPAAYVDPSFFGVGPGAYPSNGSISSQGSYAQGMGTANSVGGAYSELHHQQQQSGAHICPMCGKSYGTKEDLVHHTQKRH